MTTTPSREDAEKLKEPINVHELCRAMDEFVAANNARLKALADRKAALTEQS